MSEAARRCGRVSGAQLDALLSFMEEHRAVALGRGALLSRFASCRLWRLLAERLNALAATGTGVRRSPDRWCRYWTDIKYKVRKKWMSGGTLGELSSVEERLKNILDGPSTQSCDSGMSYSDTKERGGEGRGEGGAGPGGAEELVAEAAMRSALAAERQADSLAQGVELLRELVGLVRALAPPPLPVPATPHLRPL